MESSNKRRRFLKNTLLTSISLGLIPSVIKSNVKSSSFNKTPCEPTTLDYFGQGPFYTADSPTILNNQLANNDEQGNRLIISGVVQALDCSSVIPNTLIEIWHANNDGEYDNSGFNLRGVTYSNAQGFYIFETILPGKYLNGLSYRPSHIHFKITPQGYPALITQLYFQGDTDISTDAAASVSVGSYDATNRIIPLTQNSDGKYEGTWDVIIDGQGIVGNQSIHSEKGIIYSISPNPFTTQIEINFGVFQKANVSIQVFNNNGILVAVLDQNKLKPHKYTVIWIPENQLQNGIYFVSLKLNDLQVHYKKIIKIAS
jgi:protocatechuate 3,4-dioxygenase beta subunit